MHIAFDLARVLYRQGRILVQYRVSLVHPVQVDYADHSDDDAEGGDDQEAKP